MDELSTTIQFYFFDRKIGLISLLIDGNKVVESATTLPTKIELSLTCPNSSEMEAFKMKVTINLSMIEILTS
ncbi:MAG: hypothetical protein SH857_14055 [Chitinophagales bacterium]|nr:hypothetical protein [Chitinophagales bacterium]